MYRLGHVCHMLLPLALTRLKPISNEIDFHVSALMIMRSHVQRKHLLRNTRYVPLGYFLQWQYRDFQSMRL